jgi:hypothetical protein
MRTGRPTPLVVLSAEERLTLEQWARRPTTAQALAQRARLVLACASTQTNGEIASAAGVTRQPWGAGGIASSGSACRGCWMSRVPGRRARLQMPRSSG